MKVTLIRDSKTLGHTFKKGETPNVSQSIYEALIEKQDAEDFKEKKPAKKQKQEEE